LVRDGKTLLVTFNTHLPTDQTAYLLGDPRSNFEAGQHIDASLALHSEVSLLAEAAKRGVATLGCDMYVTTFPCPPCAAAIARSGIRRLFYAGGYSLVMGAEALRANGVKLIRVAMQNEPVPA
jgi:dCMP deaminase